MKSVFKILIVAFAGVAALTTACKGGEEKPPVTPPEIPVTGVGLNENSLLLTVGNEYQLIATVLPEEASDKRVVWESSDDSIATVDENGLVKAIAEGGPITINVTTEDGSYEEACEVIVEAEGEGEEETIDSGTAGPLTWTFTNRGTLYISGEGIMPDYEYDYVENQSSAPWNDYLGSMMKLVVNEGVTVIGKSAFTHTEFLTDISLPNSLTLIREDAFSYSGRLERITIPANVTTLEDYLFFDSYALAEVTLPEGLASLGYMAFYDCMSLAGIELPDTLTSIGNSCFGGCSLLAEIEIPEGITAIGSNTFHTCQSLEKVILPSTIESIGDSAFFYCTSLNELIVRAITPPVANNGSLYNYDSATLYVPAGSVEAYRSANNWGLFTNITAIQ